MGVNHPPPAHLTTSCVLYTLIMDSDRLHLVIYYNHIRRGYIKGRLWIHFLIAETRFVPKVVSLADRYQLLCISLHIKYKGSVTHKISPWNPQDYWMSFLCRSARVPRLPATCEDIHQTVPDSNNTRRWTRELPKWYLSCISPARERSPEAGDAATSAPCESLHWKYQ